MNTDEIINKFAKLTHSPRGRYAANEDTYQELLSRLPKGDMPVRIVNVANKRHWSAAASIALIVGISAAIACVITFGTGVFTSPFSNGGEQPTETVAAKTLTFDGEPLSSIVATLSETYHADIVIASPRLADYRLTATFTTDEPLDDLLSILAEAGDFKCEKQENRYIIDEN